MKKIILFTAMILFLATPGLFAQENIFWNRSDAYLAQTPAGDTPVVFAPGLLASPGYWVGGRVAFSHDGKQFFYGTNTTWFNGKDQKLMYFTFDGKKWVGPSLLSLQFDTPTFSTDGDTLFISGMDGVYETRLSDTGWVSPSLFLKRSYILYNFMPAQGGHYYVGSNGTWGKRQDINSWKFSLLSGAGSDTSIQNLGSPLNSPGFNGDFYIAPDESYMIISTKETPTFECELFISFRKPDNQWTVPLSLGSRINDGTAHRWGAYVSPDHKYLFYTKGTSEKDCRIYWVRFDNLFKKLKQQALSSGDHQGKL
jgi:hypothetical protein